MRILTKILYFYKLKSPASSRVWICPSNKTACQAERLQLELPRLLPQLFDPAVDVGHNLCR